jgi:hypothetical protein
MFHSILVYFSESFNVLKNPLISYPIILLLIGIYLIEIMCDASDYVVGDVLGQRVDKKPNVILRC